MALKLLNPGLRPLGMFDLDDADATNLVGGEYVELQTDDNTVEAYAADAGQLLDGDDSIVSFARGSRTAGSLGGLADDGVAGYGTLFGEMIGSTAGQATSQSGAVVIGPQTNAGSGKVTVFATAGLYGVTDGTGTELPAAAANAVLSANGTTGLLQTTGAGDDVAIHVGAMSDTSLVSTTNAAAGLASATEYFAVFYLGNSAATDATA
tara:strand:+ start:1016 stop:1639 length:624 start_codon:yes stop_codon:yes gene_type:complete